jgi:rubredoxin
MLEGGGLTFTRRCDTQSCAIPEGSVNSLYAKRRDGMGHWKCTMCSYEYHAPNPHETCPNCKEKCTFVDLSTDCRENPDFCKVPEDQE